MKTLPCRTVQFPVALRRARASGLGWILLVALTGPLVAATELPASWVGTWATSPMPENKDATTPDLTDATLRQIVRISAGGNRLRLRVSNAFGRSGLAIAAAQVALPADDSAISPAPAVNLTFGGKPGVVVPAGAVMLSDPVPLPVRALADVAITLQFGAVPEIITGHPGARATSWWRKTAEATPEHWDQAHRVDRWYFITGLDVAVATTPRAVVLLGDSITDGYGVKPGTHQRWSDRLSLRLEALPATADIGVLNQGIGGNRLLRDGLGPNILARFERDVLAQTGVRWLVVLAGINDLGTRVGARKKGEPFASADDIILALAQIATRAHSAGIKVYGGTITPDGGNGSYWSDDGEADRQAVNHWIRTGGAFDAVIDFDADLRDPQHPEHLAPEIDSGDHLHPSMAGYRKMGEVVDLKLFAP